MDKLTIVSNKNELTALSDNNTQTSKTVFALSVAFGRVGVKPVSVDKLENMLRDVIQEFPKANEEQIIKALKNGSLGRYGKTYRMCSQEICIWVRTYLQENRNPKTFKRYG